VTGAWLAGATVAPAGCIRSGAAAAAGADWVLSDDADASEVGPGSLNDSNSGAGAGRGAGVGVDSGSGVGAGVGAGQAGAGTGVAGPGATCAGVGEAAGTAVAGGVTGSAARTGKLLPHDWQLVWPRNTSLAAQNGQIGCVDP
jgi:hypothetical protein